MSRFVPLQHKMTFVFSLFLEIKLHSPKDDTQLIGCFSAASNVTGILTDTNGVTACLHRYDALAFWDYATAGNGNANKDGVNAIIYLPKSPSWL